LTQLKRLKALLMTSYKDKQSYHDTVTSNERKLCYLNQPTVQTI